MKRLHKANLYCWSEFDEDRNIDFHSYLWLRDGGNVVFDPLPLSTHDLTHLQQLGTVSHILISNSDHTRSAEQLAAKTGAEIWGPQGEQDNFSIPCSRWLSDQEDALPGLQVYALQGSKTPGELAFLLEKDTLITGDLVRAHEGGKLCLLPDAKLKDKAAATASVRRLAGIQTLRAVLPGDGWPIFRDGHAVLQELVDTFDI